MSLRVASVSWARSGPLLAHRSDEESPGCPAMRLVSNCAVCAAPVEAESGVQCGQCQTLYCGAACQGEDVGQHGQVCDQIAGAGGADQIHVNTKYDAAADAARAACAQELAGQTCFICREGDEAEGLVRGCACRGEDSGVAHLSCLIEYAQSSHQENYHQVADENSKWVKCAMCSHLFTGDVAVALAWGCLKTYLRRPSSTDPPAMIEIQVQEDDAPGEMLEVQLEDGRILEVMVPEGARAGDPLQVPNEAAEELMKLDLAVSGSLSTLARTLSENGRCEEALPIAKLYLHATREIPDEVYNPRETKTANILGAQNFVARTMFKLGQTEGAIAIQREVFAGSIALDNLTHHCTLGFGYELSAALLEINHLAEAKTLLRVLFPLADHALKEDDHLNYGIHLGFGDSEGGVGSYRGSTPSSHCCARVGSAAPLC